jgi:hypothetical protein
VTPEFPLSPKVREALGRNWCDGNSRCDLVALGSNRIGVLVRYPGLTGFILLDSATGQTVEGWNSNINRAPSDSAKIEVRERTMRQVYVDGQPLGPPVE